MQNNQHIPYSIRQLVPADVEAYKAMRLEALQKEPGNFGNSYDMEAAYPEETWVMRLANPAVACFGLYHENTLIGITAIVVTDKEKPQEAYMTQSYIRKEHRGKGLSQLLYNARINWAKQHGIKALLSVIAKRTLHQKGPTSISDLYIATVNRAPGPMVLQKTCCTTVWT